MDKFDSISNYYMLQCTVSESFKFSKENNCYKGIIEFGSGTQLLYFISEEDLDNEIGICTKVNGRFVTREQLFELKKGDTVFIPIIVTKKTYDYIQDTTLLSFKSINPFNYCCPVTIKEEELSLLIPISEADEYVKEVLNIEFQSLKWMRDIENCNLNN